MVKIIHEDGSATYEDPEFVSPSIYAAYWAGESWDSGNYVCIEWEVFRIWVTKLEQKTFSNLTNSDEVDKYIDELNFLAIQKDEFDKWRQGGKNI